MLPSAFLQEVGERRPDLKQYQGLQFRPIFSRFFFSDFSVRFGRLRCLHFLVLHVPFALDFVLPSLPRGYFFAIAFHLPLSLQASFLLSRSHGRPRIQIPFPPRLYFFFPRRQGSAGLDGNARFSSFLFLFHSAPPPLPLCHSQGHFARHAPLLFPFFLRPSRLRSKDEEIIYPSQYFADMAYSNATIPAQ